MFLHSQESNPLDYTKGSVYWATLSPRTNGEDNIFTKKRPVVIVSSLAGSLSNNLVTVCPLTTQLKEYDTNVDIEFSIGDRKSQVCCSQITTIPKSWLSGYAGEMSVEDLDRVHKGILISLGLQHLVYEKISEAREIVHTQEQNKAKLVELTAKAQELIEQLSAAIARCGLPTKQPAPAPVPTSVPKLVEQVTGRKYTKRTPTEIAEFIEDWENPASVKADVAAVYNFSSVTAATTFYKRHKDDVVQ